MPFVSKLNPNLEQVMALNFEERSDGFRVIEDDRMIASIQNRVPVYHTGTPMTTEAFKKLSDEKGVEAALKERDNHATGTTSYELLPQDECHIHSAAGPLLVGQLKEMLAKIEITNPS